ncbi:putative plant self-incompatibility S1 [Lupinus albus]|uniref:S-protein homolog n=1 Tax=Lupinus albus TaxID=3870 RepID=A0A6A4NAA8_LUPAL|nr:putative plant self-incompatibility S1 [Lupinus albus]
MAQSSKYIFLFSLISIAFFVAVSDGWWGSYTHIYIKNGLDKGTPLTVHCKSKDDDLGVHVLKYDEEYKFQFEPSFLQNTLFFCGFTWDSKLHWFDIYDQDRDVTECRPDCKWSITRDHPCMFNFKSQKYELCDYKYH